MHTVYFPREQSSAQPTPSPPTLYLPPMGRSTDRGGLNHPTLADRQQQQTQQKHQQQWGPSPQAIHAFEMYRACVAAGQLARFTVEQRREGEYYSLSSRPPPPAAAAAGGKRPGRKPN